MEESKSPKKLSTPAAIIAAAIIIALAIFIVKLPPKSATPAATTADTTGTASGDTSTGGQTVQLAQMIVATKSAVTIPLPTAADHWTGTQGAPITIVEYSDPECPFCKEFQETMQSLIQEPAYAGKIEWVYRQFPIESLHHKARNEADAIECAAQQGGNDAFWKYIDLLFATTTSNDGLDPAQLPVFAKTIGLDVTKFNTCLSTKATDSIIAKDESDGNALGIQGTPQSYILYGGNEYQIQGAYPLDAVDQALATITGGK